ncbi:multicopper oxidase [Fusarium flagelliforme]|uniref:Multicopper oxidase n=1 Tax=Fusarium flagelliforme TaxID=2675880 RepID=A0A395MA31_9HYPO|nr:multicopper oxidase [Fusarium flagelliforme]
MVAHVEEAHALLDEFEVPDESRLSKGTPNNPLLRSVYRRSSLSLARRRCSTQLRASLVTIILVLAIGLVTILHTKTVRPTDNGEPEHLAYLLHPQENASRPPTTLVFNWTITSGFKSPDGVVKQVYLVNGQFPGPLIEARSGDRIVVHVRNDLADEGVSLHWHGLLLKNQNAMDGAVGITQDPILPGSSFTYNFTIGDNEHGTFWWHSHSDLQRADGLWGGLVVHSPDDVEPFGKDYLIMVGDWFHRNQSEVLSWFVNTGSVAGFSVGLEGATLEPVSIDGGFNVQSQAVERIGILYPGQRVDLSVKWNPDYTDSRRLVIYMDQEDFGYPNPSLDPIQAVPAFAEGVAEPHRNGAMLSPNATEIQVLNSENLKAATRVTGIPPKAQQTIILYAKTEKLAHLNYKPVSFINHTSWKPQTPPLISQNRSSWDENQLVPLIPITSEQPTRVDIVINNLDDGAHPFHLHGHSFYVLSSYRNPGRDSWGSFNPYTEEAPPNGLNLNYPVRRDTVSVPRRGHVVLALVADNPGIWALHCHMLVHMARGMAMALDVRHVGDSVPDHVIDTEVK